MTERLHPVGARVALWIYESNVRWHQRAGGFMPIRVGEVVAIDARPAPLMAPSGATTPVHRVRWCDGEELTGYGWRELTVVEPETEG